MGAPQGITITPDAKGDLLPSWQRRKLSLAAADAIAFMYADAISAPDRATEQLPTNVGVRVPIRFLSHKLMTRLFVACDNLQLIAHTFKAGADEEKETKGVQGKLCIDFHLDDRPVGTCSKVHFDFDGWRKRNPVPR